MRRSVPGLFNISREPTPKELKAFIEEHTQLAENATCAMEDKLGRKLLMHGESEEDRQRRRNRWEKGWKRVETVSGQLPASSEATVKKKLNKAHDEADK